MNRRRFVSALLLGLLALATPLSAAADFGAEEQAELRERLRSATPAERRALRRELRARFRRASPEERLQLRDFFRDMRARGAGPPESDSISDPFRGEPPRSLREVVEVYQTATPEEQQEIRRRLEQRMSKLRPAQRRRAMRQLRREFKQGTQDQFRSLEGDLGGLSAAEKRRVRQQVRSLPVAERRALMQRLGRYRSLPEAEQQALRDRFSAYQALPESEQEQLRENAERFREMPEGERERLRNALRELRALPKGEREALLEEILAE